MATKNITVTGSMNTSADLAALVAGGDISITGQGTTTSSFQGLILAEGSFKAKDTTLIGSALTLDKNGSVQLERVRTVAARDLTKVDLNYDITLRAALKSSGQLTFGGQQKVGVLYNGRFVELTDSNYEELRALGQQIAADQGASQLVVETSPSVYTTTPDSSIQFGFNNVEGTWSDYEKEVKSDTIKRVDVFQLDFNKFLKTKGGLRPLLQRVTAL